MNAYLKRLPFIDRSESAAMAMAQLLHQGRRKSRISNVESVEIAWTEILCRRESVVVGCWRDLKRPMSATTARQDRDQLSEIYIKAY